MRFKTRLYRTLPRTSCDEPVFGELTLECGDNGVPAFTLDDVDNTDRFHLVYSGDREVCLHDSPLNLSEFDSQLWYPCPEWILFGPDSPLFCRSVSA